MKTMTDYELHKAAYYHILFLWSKELERKNNLMKEKKASRIADNRIKKYNAQLDELHEAIIKIKNNINYEINHYEVEREDFISAIGSWRRFDTKNFDNLEEALVYAKQSSDDGFCVTIRQINNIVGWWD